MESALRAARVCGIAASLEMTVHIYTIKTSRCHFPIAMSMCFVKASPPFQSTGSFVYVMVTRWKYWVKPTKWSMIPFIDTVHPFSKSFPFQLNTSAMFAGHRKFTPSALLHSPGETASSPKRFGRPLSAAFHSRWNPLAYPCCRKFRRIASQLALPHCGRVMLPSTNRSP